jgi:GNAT superfamily N-acetyltransferase
MFQVRKMEPKDFPFAIDLANTMNWNMTTADFVFNSKLEPNGCFILQENSERLGIATCISYGKIGWFGNLVVKEAYRKKGAGTALLNHAIEYLKGLGAKTVGLYAYQNLIDFYGKLGFKRDADFIVLEADEVSNLPRSDTKLNVLKQNDLSRVISFDEECFGASRKKALKLILQNPKNLSYLATEENQTLGYITAKIYEESAEIGPLACKPKRNETALKLLNAILTKVEGLEAYMYLPAAQTELLEAALQTGFKEEFRLSRMFLGSVVPQDCLYIAESLERG